MLFHGPPIIRSFQRLIYDLLRVEKNLNVMRNMDPSAKAQVSGNVIRKALLCLYRVDETYPIFHKKKVAIGVVHHGFGKHTVRALRLPNLLQVRLKTSILIWKLGKEIINFGGTKRCQKGVYLPLDSCPQERCLSFSVCYRSSRGTASLALVDGFAFVTKEGNGNLSHDHHRSRF